MTETLEAEIEPVMDYVHSDLRNALPLWTIYRPTGTEGWRAVLSVRYPEHKPTGVVISGDSRDAVRQKLPPGLTKLMRYPNDPVDVEEAWA